VVFTVINVVLCFQLSESLPPRTIGYKWQLVYSTALHGISLNTLYREVVHLDCPVLMVIRDTDGAVSLAMNSFFFFEIKL
jgi:hypothetical protein